MQTILDDFFSNKKEIFIHFDLKDYYMEMPIIDCRTCAWVKDDTEQYSLSVRTNYTQRYENSKIFEYHDLVLAPAWEDDNGWVYIVLSKSLYNSELV
jgi:hypothetical protein